MSFFLKLILCLFVITNIKKNIKVYKIDDNLCGETSIKNIYFKYASKFSDLKKGSCLDYGYTIFLEKEILNVPVLGSVVFNKYKKN
tara:strand:+ start:73 stop:330 length:258 start_codon:yes stop_codon:yes gene_type:complete